MKKAISFILVLVLIASLTLTAFADESQEITVSYTASESYEVVIPSSQSFSDGCLSTEDSLSATALLGVGKVLRIFMNSANGFALKCGDSSIAYGVSAGGDALDNDACVLEVMAGSVSGLCRLFFYTTEEDIASATIAGEHTDIITFSCSIEQVD